MVCEKKNVSRRTILYIKYENNKIKRARIYLSFYLMTCDIYKYLRSPKLTRSKEREMIRNIYFLIKLSY